MKRTQIPLPALAAAMLASTALSVPSHAEDKIACASEVPAARKGQGHWYYRLIDGRKCWYDGKPMMPKTSLYWPDTSAAEAEPAAAAQSKELAKTSAQPVAKPYTDGRNVGAQSPAIQSATAEPAAAPPAPPQPTMAQGSNWPAPAANEISFESRWLGLHSRN